MSENKYHVVYITDENYVMPTCVSIVSLIKNKSASIKYCVNIIADKVSEKNKNIFRELHSKDCEINIIDTDGAFYKELNSSFYQILNDGETFIKHVTASVVLKFNIQNFLKGLDTVLYLDSDIIVNQDVSDLFKIDISKNYAAVSPTPRLSKAPIFSSNKNSVGLSMDKFLIVE